MRWDAPFFQHFLKRNINIILSHTVVIYSAKHYGICVTMTGNPQSETKGKKLLSFKWLSSTEESIIALSSPDIDMATSQQCRLVTPLQSADTALHGSLPLGAESSGCCISLCYCLPFSFVSASCSSCTLGCRPLLNRSCYKRKTLLIPHLVESLLNMYAHRLHLRGPNAPRFRFKFV